MKSWMTLITRSLTLGAACAALGQAAQGDVKVEKVAYFGQPNCYRLSNGTVELIVTTDIGPRVIRYGFVGQDNMLAEIPEASVNTEFGKWRPMGGHRLWHAPEVLPRTYWPDESPLKVEMVGANGIRLIQDVEKGTGIQKEMTVTLDEKGTGVTLDHKLTNHNVWGVDLAVWLLTIVRGGGETILPQEPYRSHDDYVLPARPMVLWHYTDLSDPRWTLGKKYLRLKTDKGIAASQKIGIANKQGWAAYIREKTLFVKRFPYIDGREYPDCGSSTETYTAGEFMEVETLGPMTRVEPKASATLAERWYLYAGVNIGSTEASLDAAITPLIATAAAPK